jgi:acyl-CoA carboxylase subunit beta
MVVLGSRLDPGSDAYRANRAANLELLGELDRLLAQARAGGGPKYVERHRARGKLLARERVELLLDRDGPFLELSPLAAWGTDFPVGASASPGATVASGPALRSRHSSPGR